MKSNLNATEFKRRLSELTSEEKVFYFITPYNSAGTPFCGTFDERAFELTLNSFWTHAKAVVVKGAYKRLDNNSTEVTYRIGWTRFTKNLFIFFNVFAAVGMNMLIIINRDTFDIPLSSILLTLNGFWGFSNICVLIVNWVTKKIVDQRFREEFEIGVEDEWEKLASSIVAKPPSS
ncbi:MAG: hypothetical protein ACKO96_13965 [Flammeovirgaceae bacterium]